MSRASTFFFGRVNFTAARSAQKTEFYSTAFGVSAPPLHTERDRWQFSDVAPIEDAALGSFYEGFLTKYKERDAVEVVDTEARTIADENVKNLVVAHSRFFVHVPSGIVAYHPVGTRISARAFQTRFCGLIEHAVNEALFSAELLPINQLEMFEDALRKFSRIDQLSIYLHPSNPSNRQPWKRVDERLQAMNASQYREVYRGNPAKGGLKPEADKSIRRKIVMSEDGYGHTEVTGTVDGKTHKISTQSQPLSAQAPNDNTTGATVLRALTNSFTSILKRFNG